MLIKQLSRAFAIRGVCEYHPSTRCWCFTFSGFGFLYHARFGLCFHLCICYFILFWYAFAGDVYDVPLPLPLPLPLLLSFQLPVLPSGEKIVPSTEVGAFEDISASRFLSANAVVVVAFFPFFFYFFFFSASAISFS